MYRAAVCFLAVALLAAAVGFSGSAGCTAKFAQVVFAVAFVVSGMALLADARQLPQQE